jgi:hypothetical protein
VKDIYNEFEVRDYINALYPDVATRRIALSVFAEAVVEANPYSRNAWVVSLGNLLRRYIGHYIVCTLWQPGVWMLLDYSLLRDPLHNPTLEELAGWDWTPDNPNKPGAYLYYKDRSRKEILSINGNYRITQVHKQNWPHVRQLFFDFLCKAIHYGQKMDKRTPGNHAPGALMYIRNELEIFLPDPFYDYEYENN